jgi:hypothetical protein
LGVSFELLQARAKKSRVGEFGLELLRGHIEDSGEAEVCAVGVEFEVGIFAEGGILLIGTGKNAGVAAKEVVADFILEVGRYLAFVLDCQVADTFVCVELTVGAKCRRWAGLDTLVAACTVAGERLIGYELQVCYYFTQENLRADGGIYENVVFSDKAQSCS